MKLNQTPVILVAIAALLGGFVYFYEIQGAPQREEAQQKSKQLFSFKEEEVQAFTLKTQQQTLSFVKQIAPPAAASPKPSPSGSPTASPSVPVSAPKMIWRMTAPNQSPANEASVAYLLSLMATAKSEKALKESPSKQPEFGLDQPLAIVEVTLKNQQTQRLVLGKPDFNRAYLYAQANPPEKPGKELSVLLVPMEFENAVKRPLEEWELKVEKKPSPAPNKPSSDKSTSDKSTSDKSTSDKSTSDKSSSDKSTSDKSTSDKSSSDKSSSDKPSSDKPTSGKSTSEKPTSEKPTSEKPTSEKPTSEKPTSEKPQ